MKNRLVMNTLLVCLLASLLVVLSCDGGGDSGSGGGCNPACSEGFVCQSGECAPEGTTGECDPPCSGGFSCEGGQCVPEGTGGECDPACSAGFSCQGGQCVPADTGCNPSCSAGQTCTNGQCVPADTGCNPACSAGQTCTNGQCVGGATLDCEGLYNCISPCVDEACINKCRAQSSAAETQKLEAVLLCAKNKGCQDEDCIEAKCSDEVTVCLGGTPSELTWASYLAGKKLTHLYTDVGSYTEEKIITLCQDGSMTYWLEFSGGTDTDAGSWAASGSDQNGTLTLYWQSGGETSYNLSYQGEKIYLDDEHFWVEDGGC